HVAGESRPAATGGRRLEARASGAGEHFGDPVALRQRLQLLPRRVLDVDAVLATLLLAAGLDLTPGEHACTAPCPWRGLQVAREFGDFLFELRERAKRRDFEYGDETAVVVSTTGFQTETKPGEQPTQDLDNGRQSAAFEPLGAAQWQEGAAFPELRRIGCRS